MAKHKRHSMFWTYFIGIFLVTLLILMVIFGMIWEHKARAMAINPLIESSQGTDDKGLIKPKDLILRVDIENYIRQKFGKDGERALLIAKCESGLREDAVGINTNKTIDRGIFQLNSIHTKITHKCAFDAKCNIDAAYNIYLRQGFTPWVCNRKI